MTILNYLKQLYIDVLYDWDKFKNNPEFMYRLLMHNQ